MKDAKARVDIQVLRARVFGGVSGVEIYVNPLSEQVANLECRLESLEKPDGSLEKDCPVCGHVTLMKKVRGKIEYSTVIPKYAPWRTMYDEYEHPPNFYCFGCGKTFREQNGLVEV